MLRRPGLAPAPVLSPDAAKARQLIAAIEAAGHRAPSPEHIAGPMARTMGRLSALSPDTRPVMRWVVDGLLAQGVDASLLSLLKVLEG
jgi:FixJ family two-component response regulator